jgi:hypothetical protein
MNQNCYAMIATIMEFNALYESLYECDSFFVGYYKGGYYIITKADFYADEYGNVKLIG